MQITQMLFATTSVISAFGCMASPVIGTNRWEALMLRDLPIAGSAATIKTALVAAGTQATTLETIFEAATGADGEVEAIEAQNDVLLASSKSHFPEASKLARKAHKKNQTVTNADNVVLASTELSALDVIGLYSTIVNLQTTLKTALQAVSDKKSTIDALGYTAEVLAALETQQTAVDALGVDLIAIVPTSLQSTAQTYITEVDEDFAAVILVYSS